MIIDICSDSVALLEDFIGHATGERSGHVASAMCCREDALFWRALYLERDVHEAELARLPAMKAKAIAGIVDVSTRGKRRKAIALVLGILELICGAEEQYLENMPANLRSGERYSAAEQTVVAVIGAINSLADAY